MARVPLAIDNVSFTKIVINAESVGLTPEQFFRLCSDNPDLQLELTARKEIVIMPPAPRGRGTADWRFSRNAG